MPCGRDGVSSLAGCLLLLRLIVLLWPSNPRCTPTLPFGIADCFQASGCPSLPSLTFACLKKANMAICISIYFFCSSPTADVTLFRWAHISGNTRIAQALQSSWPEPRETTAEPREEAKEACSQAGFQMLFASCDQLCLDKAFLFDDVPSTHHLASHRTPV